MNNDNVEIVITGGAGAIAATAADHIALALKGAGATVDFPGRPQRGATSNQALRGVRAVVRMGERAQPHMLPGTNRNGFDAPTAARIAIGVVLLLVLFGAELRLHFGLRLDTIITAAAIWWFSRCCRRGTAIAP
jgi:hypothetical protein